MMRTIPPKLQKGDEIRIVAPSTSLADFDEETVELARSRFADLGLKVSFSKHAFELDEYNSSSVRSRVSDLHEAFSDRKVKAVLAASGGYNTNQLLRHLDYGLIKKNPKIVCGFSDITTLSVAIHAKTGLVTYYGPDYATFGMKKGLGYTLDYFRKCLMCDDAFEVVPSDTWSDDPWFKDQERREFIKSEGYLSINEGEAEGIIIGGNLDTFNLLQGTEFMPAQKNAVLFLEDTYDSLRHPMFEFDRRLQSVMLLPFARTTQGLAIGRFNKAAKASPELIKKIIMRQEEVKGVPVIANVNFGHTDPQITFPIDGRARLKVKKGTIKLELLEH